MEVIEPVPSSTSGSAYNVHLKYEPMWGDSLYFRVDNVTNKVFLDSVSSTYILICIKSTNTSTCSGFVESLVWVLTAFSYNAWQCVI